MFNLLIFFVLLIFIEVKIASLVYAFLTATFGPDLAFFLAWGYFFSTIYLASQILKSSKVTQLSAFKEQFSQFSAQGNNIFDSSRRVISAILLFTPGYLTDFFGFLIFFSKKFSTKIFAFISKKVLKKAFQKAAGSAQSKSFYYHYQQSSSRTHPKTKSQDPNVVDVEFTELDHKNINK